ncbi:MAG: hypothetical protein HY937_02185 [Nitrosomonadales bacterium]|nr:hypothetical protein [Nitrosomonadales bacterium]
MKQVSKNTDAQNKAQEQQPIIQGGPMQVIYADRILNVGFGPGVSKLTLGMETGPNTFAPILSVVIPTIAFMEAMQALGKTFSESDEMRTVIFDGMDKVKAQLEKKKT